MKANCSFYFLLVLSLKAYCTESSSPVASTEYGNIHGITLKTRLGRTISGFLGIPYAVPPVGKLRFTNPQPIAKGSLKEFQATKDASECVQPDYYNAKTVRGSEDCLYLYVYSPVTDLSSIKKPYPVLVYLHNGDFVRKNGSSYLSGPQYLLDKDIVLVTLNYRLGPLGFMSTNDAECPGNFGLKDQYLALQWVHDNIKAFGGDPSQVTLFGQNSGAASAHIHSFLSKTKTLFNRIIMDGATATSPTMFNENPLYVNRAKTLAKSANCSTESSKDMVSCLRSADLTNFIKMKEIFGRVLPEIGGIWSPCNEPDADGAYFTTTPAKAMAQNMQRDVPTMYGVAEQSGLQVTKHFYGGEKIYEWVRSTIFDAGRQILNGYWPNFSTSKVTEIMTNVANYYYSKPILTYMTKEEFLQATTRINNDCFYLYPISTTALSNANNFKSNIYVYNLQYRGELSCTSMSVNNNENLGAADGDVLIYLFPIPSENFRENNIERSSNDMKIVDLMVDFYASFVIDGKPSSKQVSADMWQPFKNDTQFLTIGPGNRCSPVMGTSKFITFIPFWRAVGLGDTKTLNNILYGNV